MCGIAGFLNKSNGMAEDHIHAILKGMTDSILPRGPDSEGFWADASAGIGLGHRRLAILDRSHAGSQPMTSLSGRYVIVFNGEIYNHSLLRDMLSCNYSSNPEWRGHSDTETLLTCFEAWGIEATIKQAIGMFSLAVWDRSDISLTLIRDRFGEKPLYYGWQTEVADSCFLFGSDLKVFKAHPAFKADIDRDALCLFMRHGYIPAPYSIYKGVFKLPPGYSLTLSRAQPEPVLKAYWSLAEVAMHGVATPLSSSAEDIADELEILLKSAVKQQMVADVPLGAFLSGGIDSSTIVALMQVQSSRPVRTFSIGFHEEGYNEAGFAKDVACHLGTDHTELYVTSQEILEVIPRLPDLFSEPFSDSSQIPTFLVSQLARQKVVVSLSGDGGDELFGGYNRYLMAHNAWGKLSRLPLSVRAVSAYGIRSLSPSSWNAIFRVAQPVMPASLRTVNIGDKLHKVANVLDVCSIDDLYSKLVSQWEPNSLVIGGQEPLTYMNGQTLDLPGLGDVDRMMVLDSITYLPDDILVKVDRAAMGVSLEGRVPFLDHRIAEFAWRLPEDMKFRDGIGKWILRQILYRHVPKEMVERPKMGFGIPIGIWLRGPLRAWAENLLDESRLRREGFFNPLPIRKKWQEHLSGQRNWQHHLWTILMFQAWLEKENLF